MRVTILWKSGASPDQWSPLLPSLSCPLVEQTNWSTVDKKTIHGCPVVDNSFTLRKVVFKTKKFFSKFVLGGPNFIYDKALPKKKSKVLRIRICQD